MIRMNLRHKKPINSYRGQTNNDKNEFNDDDFKHHLSPSKKFMTSSGEQIYKYSKILAKFITNANQFYRDKAKNPRKAKTQIENILEEAKVTRDQSRNLKIPKKVQQPKQKRKIMSTIQSDKLELKQPKSKQCKGQQLPKNLKPQDEEKPQTRQSSSRSSAVAPQPPKTQQQPKTQVPIQQNFMGMYSPNIAMTGFPNPAMFTNMPIGQYMASYEDMMKFAMLQQMFKNEQMKGMGFPSMPNIGSQMIPGMMSNMDLLNLRQTLYQNYMRSLSQQQPPKKNAPIHNLTQAYLQKKQSIFNQSKQKPNEIVKRANFHIGIAYHIYLKQLQKKNVDITNYDEIDPTRQSREIKERQQGGKKNTRAAKSKK